MIYDGWYLHTGFNGCDIIFYHLVNESCRYHDLNIINLYLHACLLQFSFTQIPWKFLISEIDHKFLTVLLCHYHLL
jgi:hypothetical protein